MLEPGHTPGLAVAVGFFAAATHIVSLISGADAVAERIKWKRRDTSVLGHKDPALVVEVADLPHDLREILLTLADAGSSAADEDAQRRVAYEFAQAFTDACREADDWSIRALIEACPGELDALVRHGLNSSNRFLVEPAARVSATIAAFTSPPMSGGFTDMPRMSVNSAAATGSLRARWDAAITTHDRVVDAWTDIVCNPVAALEHSILLDVTQPRTAAFIETYGHAQDLRAVHGQTFPAGDESAAKEYLSAVRKVDEAWVEAVRHAEHVGFDWLPETEAAQARKAAGWLATANDESATRAERVTAATLASERLAKVKSFLLPALALHELETRKRLELATPVTLSA